jgi:hypothetical protein
LPSERPARRFADSVDNVERIEQFTAGLASLKAAAQRAIQVLSASDPENQPPTS